MPIARRPLFSIACLARPLLCALLLAPLLSGCDQPPSQLAKLPGEHFDAAKTSQQLGAYPEAIVEVRRALRLDPNNEQYRWLLSTLLLESGDAAAAELVLERMTQLGLSHPELPVRMARLQLLLGKSESLLATTVPAVNNDNIGTVAALRYLRGKAFSAQGWTTEARDEYRLALALFDQARLQAKIPPEALSLAREMWVLQSTDADLQSAYEHHSCAETIREATIEQFDLAAALAKRPSARTLNVGPDQPYKRPSDAAAAAQDGDIINIAAGQYAGDSAVWQANNLIILGERQADSDGNETIAVELSAGQRLADNQGIWVIKGDNTVIDSIAFSGAKNNYQNGSGIRFLGSGLVVRRSRFLNNQAGILTRGQDQSAISPTTIMAEVDPDIGSHVLLEFNEFGFNGASDGQSHNVYIGDEDRLTFRYNYSHHALGGHLLKSRARVNNIRSNRLSDEQEAITSYQIDLPNGGISYIVGNVLFQSFRPGNQKLISYGAEGPMDSPSRLFVVNNTAFNQSVNGEFVRNHLAVPAIVINNLFFGTSGALTRGPAKARNNENTAVAALVDPAELNYNLMAGSLLIDGGVAVTERDGIKMYADAEYVHPANARPRPTAWKPDIGAYEYCAGR